MFVFHCLHVLLFSGSPLCYCFWSVLRPHGRRSGRRSHWWRRAHQKARRTRRTGRRKERGRPARVVRLPTTGAKGPVAADRVRTQEGFFVSFTCTLESPVCALAFQKHVWLHHSVTSVAFILICVFMCLCMHSASRGEWRGGDTSRQRLRSRSERERWPRWAEGN